MGVGKIPIINVENACASGSTALIQACAMVSAGLYDVVLALGVEKLTHPDKTRSFAAFAGAMDVDELKEMIADARAGRRAERRGRRRRPEPLDVHGRLRHGRARPHGDATAPPSEQFAMVAAKNSFHGSLNPRAQFRRRSSVEEVLADRMIVEPLTRADVLADRRRRRRRGGRERAQGARARASRSRCAW